MSNDRTQPTEEQVVFAALTNLVRLLAAELVAGKYRHDVIELIRRMDAKVDRTPIPNTVDQQTAGMVSGVRKRCLAKAFTPRSGDKQRRLDWLMRASRLPRLNTRAC